MHIVDTRTFGRTSGCLRRRNALVMVAILLFSVNLHAQKNSKTTPPVVADLRTAMEKAQEFMNAADYRKASLQLELWLQAIPKDTTALILQAMCFAKTAQADRALQSIEMAAQCGLADFRRLQAEPEFRSLQTLPKWNQLRQRVQENARDNAEFQVRFCEQKRKAKYRVLYSEDFDSTKKYHLVFIMHGNGHTPLTLLRWARELQMEDVVFVCPEAPYIKVPETLAKGSLQLSAAPYDAGVPDNMKSEVVELSATWYDDVLQDARQNLPVVNELPIVLGFSQGGFYALMLATRHPTHLRSVVLLSASYYEEAQLPERASLLRRHGIDVLHCHGRQDPLVAFQTADLIHGILQNHGVSGNYVPFEGGHWMTPEINELVRNWINDHNQRN